MLLLRLWQELRLKRKHNGQLYQKEDETWEK